PPAGEAAARGSSEHAEETNGASAKRNGAPDEKASASDEKASARAASDEKADADEKDSEPEEHEKAGEAEPKKAASNETENRIDLLPPGNPLRRKRGILTILGGGLPAFFLMAKNVQNGWAVPLGILCIFVAAWGVMDLLGTFDDPDERVAGATTLRAL